MEKLDFHVGKALRTIRDADHMTKRILLELSAKGIPASVFERALESLLARRKNREKTPLLSEARYYVASVLGIAEELANEKREATIA